MKFKQHLRIYFLKAHQNQNKNQDHLDLVLTKMIPKFNLKKVSCSNQITNKMNLNKPNKLKNILKNLHQFQKHKIMFQRAIQAVQFKK